jgi:hypothetical protein
MVTKHKSDSSIKHLSGKRNALLYTCVIILLIAIVIQLTALWTPTNHESSPNSTVSTTEPGSKTLSPKPSPNQPTIRVITPNPTTPSPTQTTPPQPFLLIKNDSSPIVTTVNWGTILIGGTSEQKIIIKNLLSTPVTISIEHSLTVPAEAEHYLTFYWHINNSLNRIEALAEVEVTLNLKVSSNAQNVVNFSFPITIQIWTG